MTPIRARQVHLDFHNSEHIPGVGERFDKRRFQEALQLGRVNHVNVFAKCAQGWSYYPTKVGTKHPTLRRNLLAEQLEACREIGVRAPLYYSIGFSDNDQRVHPEWSARGRDGAVLNAWWDEHAKPEDRKPIFSWPFLCPAGGWRDLVLRQTEEICSLFDVDGFWFDVCAGSGPCFCPACRDGMKARGLDAASDADAYAWYNEVWDSLLAACNGIVRAKFPDASIFYNGTTSWGQDLSSYQTHLEMEDLPSASGGYDRLPLRCKHYTRRGKPMVGMTGKFHTSWGEFGGFKHPDALRLECAAMVSWSAACSVGDQLHPSGEVDMETYRLIGEAFSYVEKIEDLGIGAEMYANLGLWISVPGPGVAPLAAGVTPLLPHDQGVTNMLLETQHDFEVVGPESDLSRFRTVILPGGRCLSDDDGRMLAAYLDAGGSILALHEGPLHAREDRFLLPVGAEYVGPASFECDFLAAGPELGRGLVRSPILHNVPALRTRLTDGRSLAAVHEPYFDRTYGHSISHQNAPARPDAAAHPGAVARGRVVYLPHALGRIYLEQGARIHRDLFMNALHLLYADPVLSVQLPSAGRANLLHQPGHGRFVAHLFYAPPLARGKCLVLEDMPPLMDVELALRVPREIMAATLEPQGTALPLERAGGALRVVVPRVQGHQAVVFRYR